MVEAVDFYTNDTVYILEHDKKCAFIGSVSRSDKVVPQTVSDNTGDCSDAEEVDLPLTPRDSNATHEHGSVQKPNIKVTWTNLVTGDDYSSITCPVPTAVRADQIQLIEREHVLNDTVRHARRDAVGSIVNMRTKAYGEILSHDRALLNVDCCRLRSVYPWTSRNNENHVIWNGWLGRVVAYRMLAIVRFSDGARLLVREECLSNFEAVPPTSDAFPDTVFEGAWLQGEAYNLKVNPETSGLEFFFGEDAERTNRVWSCNSETQNLAKPTNNASFGVSSTHNAASTQSCDPSTKMNSILDPKDGLVDCSNEQEASSTTTEPPYMPGHPLNLYRELIQSSATKPLLQMFCEKNKSLLERTPIFLTETKARNALWLSRLHSSVNVTVYVERLLPAEATVHWFANRRVVKQSSDKPPPSVVRGEDLSNLRPVIPYPYLSCTARDIWYYQLRESDVMYDLKSFERPEQLLYDWLTGNNDNLAAAKVPFSASAEDSTVLNAVDTSSSALTKSETAFKGATPCSSSSNGESAAAEVINTSDQRDSSQPGKDALPNAQAQDVSTPVSPKTSEVKGEKIPEITLSLTKTTPFWAQRTLFSSAHRRNRVIVNARHRLNHTGLMQWARSRERVDLETDSDSSSSSSDNSTDHFYSLSNQITADQTTTGENDETSRDDGAVRDQAIKRIMNDMVNRCTSLLSAFGSETSQTEAAAPGSDQPFDGEQPAQDRNTLLSAPEVPVQRDGSKKKTTTTTACPSSKDSKRGESCAVLARRSQMAPLRPGSWVALGVYGTYTTYDVRWQDGTFERDVPCQDLLPVYFNIDEHDFFPGSLVSLKSSKENPTATTVSVSRPTNSGDAESFALVDGAEESSLSIRNPRNYGVVLSANPKDRVCLVQWFVPDSASEDGQGSGRRVPMGPPEEAGVYELASLVDRQLNYGDILLMHTTDDPLHADLPAGYLEDMVPETGKLVIRWIDGMTTEVSRSECLFPLDALLDDDDWSADDSDEFETSDLTSESDSEWSTVSSEFSSFSSSDDDDAATQKKKNSKNTVADAAEHTSSDQQDPAVEVDEEQPDISREEATRQAAVKVVIAYQRTEAAQRLFVDRRAFVFWILRRFVVVPDELDTVMDQLGTLLAATAVTSSEANDGSGAEITVSVVDSVRAEASDMSMSNEPAQTESAGSKPPLVGRLLHPARAWDYVEESEAVQTVEKLVSIRGLMRSAYQLVHDYRIKRMYAMCDHRELFSEKHVEGILKSIEIGGGAAVQAELRSATLSSNPVLGSTGEHVITSGTEANPVSANATETTDSDNPNLMTGNAAVTCDSRTLSADILTAMRHSRMKVLIVPNSTQPFTTSVDNWRDRIHYTLAKSDSADEPVSAYMIVSANLFDQLSRYLTVVHKRLLRQLADFEACALAWLGECAPDMLEKARALSDTTDESQLTALLESSVSTGVEPSGTSVNRSASEEKLDTLFASLPPPPPPPHKDPSSEPGSAVPCAQVATANEYAQSCSVPSVDEIPAEFRGQFVMEDSAPTTHRFYRSCPDNLPKPFYKAWKRDTTLLSTSLPRGIVVRGFGDRIDLYSLLIVGPAGTPYEHGLFLFDIQLPARYPSVPPKVHYYAFASERVNPNLYVEGHVCLSLLGTWAGKDSENWSAENSNLLQLVVSLQGLILNSEPYFNEAGFDACRGTAEAHERSRVYNESVVATLVQSMVRLLQNPIPVFREEIVQHCLAKADAYAQLLEFWASLDEVEFDRLRSLHSKVNNTSSLSTLPSNVNPLPDFPLAPVSRGFQISVRRHRLAFLELIETAKRTEPS